jgi:hypothetical protein
MEFNRVKKVDIDEIKLNQVQYAKEFSEGSRKLEKTLLMLWNAGFETNGCCRGHKGNPSEQYIGLAIKSKDKIVQLLSSLDQENLHFSIVRLKDSYGITIRKYCNKSIYDNVMNALKGKKVNKQIEHIITKVLNYKAGYYVNIHYYFRNNQLKKCTFQTDDPMMIHKNQNKYKMKPTNHPKLICFTSNEYLDLFD